MNSLKIHQRFLIFITLVLMMTCLVSPWLAAGAGWFERLWAVAPPERYPFSRIFNRTFMIAGIALFLIFRRYLKIASLSQIALAPSGRIGRDLGLGCLLSLASMIALACAMTFADAFTPFFRLTMGDSLARFGSALLSAVFAGFLEEVFFRGILFKSVYENGRRLSAFFFVNLFYAALHFVKPPDAYVLETFDPLAGFRHLFSTFAPFLDLASLLPGLFGLFIIGMILSYALARTASLYLSIGLHAGWIFSLKTIRIFGDYTREGLGWMFGSTDPKIVSGVISWIGLIMVAVAVHRITRQRRGLVPASRGAKATAATTG